MYYKKTESSVRRQTAALQASPHILVLNYYLYILLNSGPMQMKMPLYIQYKEQSNTRHSPVNYILTKIRHVTIILVHLNHHGLYSQIAETVNIVLE